MSTLAHTSKYHDLDLLVVAAAFVGTLCAIWLGKRVVAGLGRLWAYVRVCAHAVREYRAEGRSSGGN